jgi:hypothetical protein
MATPLTQFLPLLNFLQTTLIVNSDLGLFKVEKTQTDEYEVFNMIHNYYSTFMHIGLINNIMLLNQDTEEETILYE